MGDLTTIHSQARKLVFSLKEGLEKLEALEAGPSSSRTGDLGSSSLARELRNQFNVLQRTSTELESVWRMHVLREHSSKRGVWKSKVEQVTEEVHALRISLDKFGSREQRRLAEKQDREELFSRAEGGRKAKQDMDTEAQMMGSIGRSKRALEEIYQSGSNILVNMAGSRERLKRAHRKVLDVINSVGLGETLLKLIERRQRVDIWVAYGGMGIVLVVTGALMWWVWS